MKTQFSLVLFFSFFISIATAQTGKVSGTIFDVEANDVMPFANVSIKGTSTGTTSDFEGDFTLNAAPGTYNLKFSFVGYETLEVTGV